MESKYEFGWRRCRPAAGVPVLLAGLTLAVLTVFAQAPAWWINRSVLATNAVSRDFAPINQGQLKWLAKQTAAEFGDNGLASPDLVALVASFSPTNNYFTVNLGQLKNVARPFYDLLWVNALTNCYPPGAGQPYPWSGSTNPVNNHALANIGQAKYLFSFDLAAAGYSTLNDGVPDWWKIKNGIPVTTPAVTLAADGQTLWQHFRDGTPPGSLWQGDLITIPNAWAVYTNTTQVAVVADIRSANPFITITAAEFFLDTTNGVTFGTGTMLNAMDGAFNATNELAQAIFTPAFPMGERHVFYIHAQGTDNRWGPFVAAILNPTIDDILDKVQANYSAIRDLQFDVSDSALMNGEVQSSAFCHVKQKGAYLFRIENYSNGVVEIINHNFDVKLNAQGQVISYIVAAGMDDITNSLAAGPSKISNNEDLESFYWDISTFRQAYSIGWDNNAVQGSNGCYSLIATGNDATETISMVLDGARGVPISLTFSVSGATPFIRQWSKVAEIRPGVWLPLRQTDSMTFRNGNTMEWGNDLSAVQMNTGLSDTVFAVPPAP